MKTLVTGGAGFIGAALVERLLAEGHTVDVVDNLSTGSLWNLADARAGAGRDLTFHQLDVRSADVGELIIRRQPEVVWHLAASDTGDRLVDAQVNITGALGVIEASHAAGVRKVVVASAASVYGSIEGRRPATEADARQPTSGLAIAKHTIDTYLAADDRVVFTSLILGTVYGPRATGGVVAAWAERLLEGKSCTVFGDGSQVRDLVYVDDVVDALARAASRGDGMFINVGTGRGTSLGDLHAEMAAHATPAAEPVRYAPARPGEPRALVLDPNRAAAELDWKPWTRLREGIANVMQTRGPATVA